MYIYHIISDLNPLKKFTSSRVTDVKDIFPWNHEDHLNQHENSHKGILSLIKR